MLLQVVIGGFHFSTAKPFYIPVGNGNIFVEHENQGNFYTQTIPANEVQYYEEYKEPRKKTFKFSVVQGIGDYKDVSVYVGDYKSNEAFVKIGEFEYEWTEKV